MSLEPIYQLSIITINYNNLDGLKKTVESVVSQTYDNFEYIVIDGNSNDGSSEFLSSINRNHFKYISEPDNGIYNAMNKGIAKASGDYLLFLNSGDFLENPQVLTKVNPYLTKDYAIISGDIIFNELSGKRLREHPEEITFSYLVGNAISHPSTFIKSELFNTYGKYEEHYKIVADWAFFLKVLGLNNESYLSLNETITVFNVDGVSTKSENFEKVYAERNEVLKAYFPRVYNNENDLYIFKHFISSNKRFRYLKMIERFPLFRKITTIILGAIAFILKPFKSNK